MKVSSLPVLVMIAGLAGPAAAQDWSGVYVGGHFGGVQTGGAYDAFTPWNGFAGFDMQGLGASVLGGGVQIGRNWDQGSYVLGLEAQGTAFGANRTSTTSILRGAGVPPFSREVSNMVTLTPRIGVKTSNMLVYAKAGLALGQIGASHDQGGTWLTGGGTAAGWTVGIGAEFPVAERLTGRIELTHADFGAVRTDLPGAPAIWTTQAVTTQTVTLGFNYYFK